MYNTKHREIQLMKNQDTRSRLTHVDGNEFKQLKYITKQKMMSQYGK